MRWVRERKLDIALVFFLCVCFILSVTFGTAADVGFHSCSTLAILSPPFLFLL